MAFLCDTYSHLLRCLCGCTLFFAHMVLLSPPCRVEVNGYGNEDTDHKVFFKLNGETVYLRSLLLGFVETEVRGFHLGYVNTTSCTLVGEPVVCDTFYLASGSPCVVDYITSFTEAWHNILMLLATGDAYALNLYNTAKDVLRPLGIPESYLTSHRTSMALVARPGCHYIGATFSQRAAGPSNLLIDFQDSVQGRGQCAWMCLQSDLCTSLTHRGGDVCTLHQVETSFELYQNRSQRYRENLFDKLCGDIFYRG